MAEASRACFEEESHFSQLAMRSSFLLHSEVECGSSCRFFLRSCSITIRGSRSWSCLIRGCSPLPFRLCFGRHIDCSSSHSQECQKSLISAAIFDEFGFTLQ